MMENDNPKQTLWIVGKVTDYPAKAWEFIGVFDEETVAIRACRTAQYFVGPAKLNKALPDEAIEWEGAFYPKETHGV